jgi:hypothetical protein
MPLPMTNRFHVWQRLVHIIVTQRRTMLLAIIIWDGHICSQTLREYR